jgi:methylglutaconyl-CoA hydratase
VTAATASDAPLLRSLDRRGVATLILNRPDKANSYNQALLTALLAELSSLGADPAVRAIVVRGNGRHFCAGAEIGAAPSAAADQPRASIPAMCLALDGVAKPTVALVHGACIGGAVAMVSCCDIVLAAADAFFSIPEVRLGIAPGPLMPFFLRAIDARSLRRYLLSGERFAAEEARRIGLVHMVCAGDTCESALAGLLDELLLGGPNAVAQAKQLLRRLAPAPISADLVTGLQNEFEGRHDSPEAAEGRASFREKRKPTWYRPPS